MSKQQEMERYFVITEKNPREIVLLRGRGCAWRTYIPSIKITRELIFYSTIPISE